MTESVGRTPTFAGSAAHHSFGLTDVLLFAMAVIWGINFVVVKYATHIFNPVAFTGLRVLTAAVFLVMVALGRVQGSQGSKGTPAPLRDRLLGSVLNKRDVIRLLMLGVL